MNDVAVMELERPNAARFITARSARPTAQLRSHRVTKRDLLRIAKHFGLSYQQREAPYQSREGDACFGTTDNIYKHVCGFLVRIHADARFTTRDLPSCASIRYAAVRYYDFLRSNGGTRRQRLYSGRLRRGRTRVLEPVASLNARLTSAPMTETAQAFHEPGTPRGIRDPAPWKRARLCFGVDRLAARCRPVS